MLSFSCSVANFTLAANAQRILEGVVGLAFIEADLGTALHVSIEQPVDDEQRPFDPPDFT